MVGGGHIVKALAGPLNDAGLNVSAVGGPFNSRAAVDAAFDQAAALHGTPQLVVFSLTPTALMAAVGIDQMPSEDWTGTLNAAMVATVYVLQACHRLFEKTGGTIVLLGPALSLVGASGLCALSTLLEAQRGLVKSAARQWGALGIHIHWIAVGAAGNYPELDTAAIPVGPELGPPPPALGHAPGVGEIAPVIAFLASSGARALTGTTLMADGGNWMVP